MPPRPRDVQQHEPEIIICPVCGGELAGKINAVKHLMADHGYGLTEANAKTARVLLGVDGMRSRTTALSESI